MPWTTPETFTAGQTLTAASMNLIQGNLNALYAPVRRIAHVERAAPSNVATFTSAAGGSELFTTDLSFTADGTSTYIVEAYVPYAQTATNAGASINVNLTDGAGTLIATLGAVASGNGTQAAVAPVFARLHWTPSAGTKTLNITGFHSVAAGVIGSNTNYVASFLSVYGPALA